MDYRLRQEDAERVRAAMPRLSCARRAQAALVVVLVGCSLGAAQPVAAQAPEAPSAQEQPVAAASDGKTGRADGEALALAVSDAAGSESSRQAPRIAALVHFASIGSDFVVPYGVDVPSWLNARDGIFLDASLKPISTADVAHDYFNGIGPFAYADGVSAYPLNGTLSEVLVWAEHDSTEVTMPDIDGLIGIGSVAYLPAIDGPEDIPLAPESVLDALRIDGDADGPANARKPARTGSLDSGDLSVWLTAADSSPLLSAAQEDSGRAIALSDSYALDRDAAFSSQRSGVVLAIGADDIGTGGAPVYVKVPYDVSTADGGMIYAGQVLRVTVRRDAAAPVLGDVSVTGPSGAALDASRLWISEGMLTLGSDGLEIAVPVSDPAPVGTGESSGIETEGAVLVATDASGGRHEVAGELADGVATFKLAAQTLGAGSFDIASAEVVVSDAAGNESRTCVGTAAFLEGNGIDRLRIVDASAQAPTVGITVTGDSDDEYGDDASVDVSNASEIDLAVTISDPLFAELRRDPSWTAAGPIVLTVDDGEPMPLDPGSFADRGDGVYSMTLPDDVAALVSTEGSHEIALAYEGASLVHPGIGDFHGKAATSFLVDRTSPSVDAVGVEGGVDAADVAELPADERILVRPSGDGLEVSLHVTDLNAADAGLDVSGPASLEAHVVRREGPDAGSPVVESDETIELDGSGDAVIDLGEVGLYDFHELALVITDRAGNESSTDLATVLPAGGEGVSDLDGAAVTDGEVAVDLAVVPPGGASAEGAFVPGDSSVELTVTDPWFSLRSRTPGFRQGFEATVVTAAGEVAVGADDMDPTAFEQRDSGAWTLELPLPRDGEGFLVDGTYRVGFSLLGASDSLGFGVDACAPVITGADAGEVSEDAIASMEDGRRILVGAGRAVRVRVQDLLPRAAGDASAEDIEGDEPGTSGVAVGTTVSISRLESVSGGDPVVSTAALEVDGDGWAEVELGESGIYDLDGIAFDLVDACGNERHVTLLDYVETLPEDERSSWNFDSILVDAGDTERAVDIDLADAPGNPVSADEHFHRGDVVVTATIQDRWFPVYRALRGSEALLAGSVKAPGAEDWAPIADAVRARDFSPALADDGSAVWTATFELPRSIVAPELPLEGEYELDLAYGGVSGMFGGKVETGSASFGVDYTAPSFGELSFSAIEPYPLNEDDEPWGWIFAEREDVALEVSDNLSGVDADGSELSAAGTASPELVFSADGEGSLSGELSFSLTGDGTRLELRGTGIRIVDRAGNAADLSDLISYENSNLPEGAVGIAIDTEAPRVSLSFDNVDVRNGMYYNAARMGTVTVVDASFDLVRRFDPELEVAVVSRDGRRSAAVAAQDFEEVELEDGTRAWRATYSFEDDADWGIAASHTDPMGRSSETATEEFVIDTQAPALMVEFDNDDAANGMYYKAPRTATITLSDRNFDPSLGSVAASNLSGGPAPAASGFSEVEPRSEWVATASFTGEQHYRLQVSATDLAGNVAEPFDTGEFVIDMTPPSVSISGVDAMRAYAGDVAPVVSFSDTNLDTMGSLATLEGVRGGIAYTPDMQESASETEMTTSFGNIPYEVESDDVYTVAGEGIDLAGNTATASTMFSVNRFGSTYYFAPGSEGIAGAYLTAPRDVRVVEVNVSGIDTSRSHVELAHDDRASELVAGSDYDLAANESVDGWSATTYTFPAELFSEEGYYRILLTSTDRAGNLAQNTMAGKGPDRAGDFPINFAIDGSAPSAGLIGVNSGGVYLDPAKTAQVDGHDNLAVASASLLIDGREAGSWSAEELGAGELPTIQLEVDGEPHTYVLEVRDRAGNVSTATYDDVVVTGDWLTFILNTPRLLIGSAGGAVILLGIIGAAAYLAWRRRRSTDYRRNPFGHGSGGAD